MEYDRWKATEFRTFILYAGPVALHRQMDSVVYKNFLMFHVAIHLLSNPRYHEDYCDYAQELLVNFVEHYSEIYGADQVLYNIHNLAHLAGDVRNHGSLHTFSAFPFESFLGHLKHLVRKRDK